MPRKKGQETQNYDKQSPHILFQQEKYGGVFLLVTNTTPVTKEPIENITISENTNTFYISSKDKGTVKVVEHFSGNQTYDDIIKAALRREFSN